MCINGCLFSSYPYLKGLPWCRYESLTSVSGSRGACVGIIVDATAIVAKDGINLLDKLPLLPLGVSSSSYRVAERFFVAH